MKLITPVFKLFACTLCRAKRGACRKARGLRSSLPLKVSFWLKIWMVVHFPNRNWEDWSSDATDGICRASVNAERSESQQASPQPHPSLPSLFSLSTVVLYNSACLLMIFISLLFFFLLKSGYSICHIHFIKKMNGWCYEHFLLFNILFY